MTDTKKEQFFEPADKVWLHVGKMKFKRTVLEIIGCAVYLAEGGDSFENGTGQFFGEGANTWITHR